jgi:hypothetical protein
MKTPITMIVEAGTSSRWNDLDPITVVDEVEKFYNITPNETITTINIFVIQSVVCFCRMNRIPYHISFKDKIFDQTQRLDEIFDVFAKATALISFYRNIKTN